MAPTIDSGLTNSVLSSLEARSTFFTLNTTVSAVVADWAEAWRLPRVKAFFEDFERRFSRFSPASELSRLNRNSGREVEVSTEMLDLLARCRRFSEVTHGIFNPAVLDAVEASGYDRSFETLPAVVTTAQAASPVSPFSVRIDAAARTVQLPEGARLDFGGVAKGYVVDRAIQALGNVDCVVDGGGDIFASGRAPDGGPWLIDVAHPLRDGVTLARLALSGQAVATSSVARRRWQTANGWANHIIDPRTGRPVQNGVVAATAIAPEAAAADVYAKTALILGPQDGLDFLHHAGAEGLIVLTDGSVLATNRWPDFLA